MTTHPPAEEPRPRVLYVDDQQGNLTVFKANLKAFVDITTATSAEEALKLLETEEFPIIISDQRMTGMTGSDFLAEVRRRHPDTIRMLLTAYTDFDAVVDAINEGQIARFIRKPWERDDMLATIIGASKLYWRTRENRALTMQLLHRERIAAIGQLTSGLVHELGNMTNKLTVVTDIREAWGTDEDMTREFEILQTGVDGIRMMLETLRIYARGGDELVAVREPVDLDQLLRAWMPMVKIFPHVRELKKLEYTPCQGPVQAEVDVKKIEQVIVNLVKNAGEAAGLGGTVTVWLEERGDRVAIHIRDNGPGIPPLAQERIWEPFFTTKGKSGTGLGLLMCRKIMDAHKGTIEFANNPERGCTFTVEVPRVHPKPAGA